MPCLPFIITLPAFTNHNIHGSTIATCHLHLSMSISLLLILFTPTLCFIENLESEYVICLSVMKFLISFFKHAFVELTNGVTSPSCPLNGFFHGKNSIFTILLPFGSLVSTVWRYANSCLHLILFNSIVD